MTGIVLEHNQARQRRWQALCVIGMCMLLLPAGCDSVQGTGKVDGGWPWRPSDMRVHELTRITRANDSGKRMVEVRVEFLDRDRDPTKAHGTLTVELTRVKEGDEPEKVVLDLADPDVSKKHYENVTGTYVVRINLNLPGLVPGRHIKVVAIYQGLDGARFRSSRELTWPE